MKFNFIFMHLKKQTNIVASQIYVVFKLNLRFNQILDIFTHFNL